jgi:hypothetical protein
MRWLRAMNRTLVQVGADRVFTPSVNCPREVRSQKKRPHGITSSGLGSTESSKCVLLIYGHHPLLRFTSCGVWLKAIRGILLI